MGYISSYPFLNSGILSKKVLSQTSRYTSASYTHTMGSILHKKGITAIPNGIFEILQLYSTKKFSDKLKASLHSPEIS